jgi:hypothetical protein
MFTMTPSRRVCLAAALAAALCVAVRPAPTHAQAAAVQAPASTLPDRLSDAEYWKLLSDISEPGGYFRIADNFTSNENEVGRIFTMLRQESIQGGVYMGVGPEQNLSYIASIRPAMAFVCDIRRQAVMQHLMFKAVFELSKDRADFISLLFSKPRPAGLEKTSNIQQMWNSYFTVATDGTLMAKNHALIVDHLTKTHKFTLTPDEASQLDFVIDSFAKWGPSITTNSSPNGRGGGNALTFADLTGWSLDDAGQPQSFLSTDEHFQTLKTLHEKNLIVPVSGDFGGPKAIRAIGTYVREHRATVSAFYVSNVEQYLYQDGKQTLFYDNVATLPLTEKSVFIRPYSLRRNYGVAPLCGMLQFLQLAKAGRMPSNNDALACGK